MKRGRLSLQGGMRGGKLPNQLITSPETVKFIEDTHIKTLCAEKIKVSVWVTPLISVWVTPLYIQNSCTF